LLLCVCTAATETAKRQEISYNLHMQDATSYATFKSQRLTIIDFHVKDLEAILETKPDLSDDARAVLSKNIVDLKRTIDRYISDPVEKDGVKELTTLAANYQQQRDIAQRRLPFFTYGQLGLQIALLLLATNLILQTRELTFVVATLGIAAGLITLNGFVLVDFERALQSLT
jgi:Domain of unknown function (DUF4337)